MFTGTSANKEASQKEKCGAVKIFEFIGIHRTLYRVYIKIMPGILNIY
jgi:hypothetical protein